MNKFLFLFFTVLMQLDMNALRSQARKLCVKHTPRAPYAKQQFKKPHAKKKSKNNQRKERSLVVVQQPVVALPPAVPTPSLPQLSPEELQRRLQVGKRVEEQFRQFRREQEPLAEPGEYRTALAALQGKQAAYLKARRASRAS